MADGDVRRTVAEQIAAEDWWVLLAGADVWHYLPAWGVRAAACGLAAHQVIARQPSGERLPGRCAGCIAACAASSGAGRPAGAED